MASVDVTTAANGNAISPLLTKFLLGAHTISQGLIRVVPNHMEKFFVERFRTDNHKTITPEAIPSTLADAMFKDEVELVLGDYMFYDRFNPLRDFEADWKEFWATGKLTDAQASREIRRAIEETVVLSVNSDVEEQTWQGDTLSGDAWLANADGLEKIIEGTAGVNIAPPLGAIDKANVLDILEGVKNSVREDLLVGKRNTLKIMMNYQDFEHAMDAYRDLGISKGINVMDGDVPRFAGIPLYQTGISKDKIACTIATTGTDSNLIMGTWMDADRKGVSIDRLQADSELWFAKVLYKIGFNIARGEDVSYYLPI